MRLMREETGERIDPGAVIHLTSGPSVGQAWKFERVVPLPDGHKIHCTRSHPRTGRLHREFHPRLFGCRVVVEVAWYRDRPRMKRWFSASVTQFVLLTVGGVIAWLVAEYGNAQLAGVLALVGARPE